MYLDTSILVKLFVRERDSEYYGRLTDGQEVSSSRLAYTEVFSALLIKERNRDISAEQRARAWQRFSKNVEDELIQLIPAGEAVFRKANWILQRCYNTVALRSLDAIHLASCDQIQDWPLCTNDIRMRQAAEVLGFTVTDLPVDPL